MLGRITALKVHWLRFLIYTGHIVLVLLPELSENGVRLAIPEAEVLILFGELGAVLDFLPPFADELHDVLGTQILLSLDLFPLFLREKDVRRQRLSWWLLLFEDGLLLGLQIHLELRTIQLVPVVPLGALLERLQRVSLPSLSGRLFFLVFLIHYCQTWTT